MFKEILDTDSQIFAYKDSLTYDFEKRLVDVRITDVKGNTICVYHNGKFLTTRVWADKISKKLSNAADTMFKNIDLYYEEMGNG